MKMQLRHKFYNYLSAKIALLLFVCCSFYGYSQKVITSIDSSQIKIGSQFNLTIKTTVSKKDKVVFPKSPFFGKLEVLENYPTDTVLKNDKIDLIKRYGLTQFDSGRYVIPELEVLINKKSFRTDSLSILVNPVAVDTLKQKLYDIKPVIEVAKPTSYFWWYVLLALFVIALINYLLYYFIKKNQEKKNEVEAVLYASPIEKAINLLEELEKKHLWQNGDIKAYYSELTDITRNYIEEAIKISAMESTSNELYVALKEVIKKRKIQLSNSDLENYKKVMATSDLVKFAKSKPLDFEIENDKKTIDSFLISLDKALPRTEDEEENLFLEEVKTKKEKQQRKERVFIPLGIAGFLLLTVVVFVGVNKGTAFIKENLFGSSTKSLLESEWVTSTYGNPPIKMETPRVLTRLVNRNEINNLPSYITSQSQFTDGALYDDLLILVSTFRVNDTIKIDFNQSVDGYLQMIQKNLGASNITYQEVDYEDPRGLTGRKVTGTFMVPDMKKGEMIRKEYAMLLTTIASGNHETLIICNENDEYGKQIMERVFDSIEVYKE